MALRVGNQVLAVTQLPHPFTRLDIDPRLDRSVRPYRPQPCRRPNEKPSFCRALQTQLQLAPARAIFLMHQKDWHCRAAPDQRQLAAAILLPARYQHNESNQKWTEARTRRIGAHARVDRAEEVFWRVAKFHRVRRIVDRDLRLRTRHGLLNRHQKCLCRPGASKRATNTFELSWQ